MSKDYVERRDGSFYLVGSRVPLSLIVHEFRDGETPEAIRSNFPALSLEQVYGAITFYLGSKEEVDRDLAERRRVEEDFIRTHPAPPELMRKLERAREQVPMRRS